MPAAAISECSETRFIGASAAAPIAFGLRALPAQECEQVPQLCPRLASYRSSIGISDCFSYSMSRRSSARQQVQLAFGVEQLQREVVLVS